MSEIIPETDILEQYRYITNKLKRRFLRKPNLTEACDLFTNLCQKCENYELPAYAGLCWIAAARCEGSLSNIPGETSCLVQSGRQFFKAEEYDYSLGCPSPGFENLHAGLSSYTHAATKYPENNTLCVGLDLEIVDFLNKINKDVYSIDFLNDAIEISNKIGDLDTKIYCLQLLTDNLINNGDYSTALEKFTDITENLENLPMNGARFEIQLSCEIGQIFLLLILKPTPQKLSPKLAKLLEKYTWGDKNDKDLQNYKMPEKLFLNLQSLVLTCQSLDTSSLAYIEGCLWPFLSKIQKELLRILIKLHEN